MHINERGVPSQLTGGVPLSADGVTLPLCRRLFTHRSQLTLSVSTELSIAVKYETEDHRFGPLYRFIRKFLIL